MIEFLSRRLAAALVTLVLATFVVFAVVEVLPGDPALVMLGTDARPDTLAALRAQYGFDQPLSVQYLHWIGGLLTFDLGASHAYGTPVAKLIGDRLAVTLPLAGLALGWALLVAVPLGVFAAWKHGRAGDWGVMGFTQIGISIPNFWFGIVLVLLFAVSWQIFPAGGFPGWAQDAPRSLLALVLPAIALSLSEIAILTRVTRAAMLDTLREDYIRTARAKGASERTVLFRHALRNALIPVTTVAGLIAGFLVAGAVIIESVFRLPGVGQLVYDSINNRDLAVIKNVVILFTILVLAVNLLVDLAYAVLDPQAAGGGVSAFLARARHHPGFQLGALLLVLFIGTALVSFVWTPYAVDDLQMRSKLLPSSPEHWLGTDHLGRDVLSRIMVGAKTSLAVGLIAVGLGMSAGVTLGAWAAARGGWVDELLSRTSDLIFAFPAVLIAILITSVLGASAANAILAIAIFNVPVFARVTRGAALAMWSRDFVRAAIALGRAPLGITLRHVLPNIASVLIVQATIQFAVAILAEAGLSYLGLGAQPPTPSWGGMLRDAQTYIFQVPELAIWPGVAIALAVLGLNMLGDGLRDLLDPRLRLLRVG